jgi:hypothetical protein
MHRIRTQRQLLFHQESIRTDIQTDGLVPLPPVMIEYHQHRFLYTQIDRDDFPSRYVPGTDIRELLTDHENGLPVIHPAFEVLFNRDHWIK